MDLIDVIRKHVLKNAFDYGKAQAGSVVGKVIGELPDSKKDMKETMKLLSDEVARVNKLSKSEIESEMQNYTYEEKKEEEKKISVPNAVLGNVIVRFPPEPNGYSHIGHAKAALLSQAIKEEYDGKFILRWDDTNPEKEKQEYVEAIKEDLEWLGLKFDAEIYASDFMPKLYELQEQLFKQSDSYVCTCKPEKISEMRAEQKPCPCRDRRVTDNLTLWKEMLAGKLEPGSAVVLLKGNLHSCNTAMRDPSLWRVLKASHYRQNSKYRVWPTYDFEGAVMDSLTGVTHALRSKEYDLRNETYAYLLDKLKLHKPELISISRLEIKGSPISKRLLKPLVDSKVVSGWNDPRLPTIRGLRRRGVSPLAIKNFVLQFGISKVESEPPWERLLVENRKLLEPIAKHFFAVIDPVEVIVVGLPEELMQCKRKVLGRVVEISDKFYISKMDAETLQRSEVFRFKELYNVQVLAKQGSVVECEFAGEDLKEGTRKLQWISASKSQKIDCSIAFISELLDEKENFRLDSLIVKNGLCESACKKLEVGKAVQFERIGFCKLDEKKENKLEFILTC